MMNVTEIVKHCRVTEQRNINISKASTHPDLNTVVLFIIKWTANITSIKKRLTVANLIALSKKDIHNFLPGVRSPPKSF